MFLVLFYETALFIAKLCLYSCYENRSWKPYRPTQQQRGPGTGQCKGTILVIQLCHPQMFVVIPFFLTPPYFHHHYDSLMYGTQIYAREKEMVLTERCLLLIRRRIAGTKDTPTFVMSFSAFCALVFFSSPLYHFCVREEIGKRLMTTQRNGGRENRIRIEERERKVQK